MTLSKICFVLAFFYTLTNAVLGVHYGHPALGLLVSLPGNTLIWGIWAAVRTQVKR